MGKRTDILVEIVTVALFFSFYALNLNVYGSYLFFGLSVLVLIINAAKNHGKIIVRLNNYHKLVLQFALFCLVSSLWAWESSYSIEKGVTIIEILISMSMLGTYYFYNGDGDELLKCVKWGGYAVAIYSIVTYGFTGLIRIMQAGERAGTGYANINSIAMACAYATIITVYYSLKNGITWTDLFSVPCVIMVVASGTRKAVIVLAVGLISLLLMNSKEKKSIRNISRIIALFIIFIAGLYLLARFQLLGGISHRMEGIINLVFGTGRVDSSTLKRSQFIAIGIEQFKKTPIAGIGIGNPRILLRSSSFGLDAYLHNNYAELLAGGGILGFISYYAIHFNLLVLFWKRRNWDSSALFFIAFIIMLLIADYGAVSYYSKNTYFYFLMMFAYILRNPAKANENYEMNR